VLFSNITLKENFKDELPYVFVNALENVKKYHIEIKKKIYSHFKFYHKKKYSKKNLDILLGDYLSRLTNNLYERWLTIDSIIKKGKFSYQDIDVKIDPNYDLNFFYELFNKPAWNYLIYKEICEHKSTINKKIFKIKKNKKKITLNSKHKNSSFIRKLINNFFYILLKKKKFIFYCTGFSKINEIILNLKYNNLPLFLIPESNSYYLKNFTRLKLNIYSNSKDPFLIFFFNFYNKYAPSILYENFNVLKKRKFKLNNKEIFTSIGHYYDMNFRYNIFSAKNKKINFIQHGGDNFFCRLPSEMFLNDYKICNKYYSFTKNLPKLKKIFKLKSIFNFKKKFVKNKLNNFLIIMPPYKKYFTQLYSNQYEINSIRHSVLKLISGFRDRNINFKIKFFNNQCFTDFNFDLNKEEICDYQIHESKSDFFILTYFGTTFYELLSKNRPFVFLKNQGFDTSYQKSFKSILLNAQKENIILDQQKNYFLFNNNFQIFEDWWSYKTVEKSKEQLRRVFCGNYYNSINDI
jgi:putative transferase (TIGR04331 family)